MQVDAQEQIEKFQEFIETHYLEELHDIAEKGRKAIILDFAELSKFDPDIAEQLLEFPEDTLRAAELSIEQFDLPESAVAIKVRFTNLPNSQKILIRNIRSIHLGNLIVIDSLVRQASDVRPQVVSAKFECPSCGNTISILQLDTKFKEPSRCSCGRKGKFRLISKDLVDAQRLVVEECPESLEGGEQPKRISIFLKEDLVEPKLEKKTTPGSKVRVIGIIKEIPVPLRTGGISTRYDLVVEANQIESLQESFEDIELSNADMDEMIKLSKDPKVYEKLASSIAPSIYGHDNIKEALILQLMGGVRKVKKDGTITRGDMHILLVGDPGAGKSQLLQFISKAAPKARFVSGKGASGAGLTASVVKDEFLRGWSLEAGAMVLANMGICAIDELDKMSVEDRSALHEALEQQTITISKANIQATLRAETTVLAAANPKLGRFDPYSSIAAQIDLPPALINRFDLIFPIRDIPDKAKDSRIARHVLKTQQTPDNLNPVISKDVLRKYISYAKQKIFPQLSDAAIEEIENFYVSLRNTETKGTDDNIKPIPISARQLEALVRLAEGSARVRLSKEVTRTDAKRAISLLKHCLMQVGIDPETGQIDIDRISTGISASTRNKIVTVKEIIREIEATGKTIIPIEDILAKAVEKGISEDKVEDVIDQMKREGEIFEPRRGHISKL